MNIAIIPARGGSKRIPRKNIKLFHGKPLIAYSIEAAKQSGCFERIMVSTDDPEIAEVARSYGAEVPFIRPENIADDYATTMDVIQHTLSWCDAAGIDVDSVCCIYATAPLLQAHFLQQGLTILQQEAVDYVFSATSFSFPIQRAITIDKQQGITMFSPEHANTRSQDLVEAFHDAGQFYWGRVDAFANARPIFDRRSKAVILPRKYVQDIDTLEDWELAEAMFQVIASQS